MRKTLLALAITLSLPGFARASAFLNEADAAVPPISAGSPRQEGLAEAREAMAQGTDPASAKLHAHRAEELLAPYVSDGDSAACWHLGYLYASGQGLPLDVRRGEALVRVAADGGDAAAAYWLASREVERKGHQQEAIRLFSLAAVQGHLGAREALNRLQPEGPTPEALAPTPAAVSSATPIRYELPQHADPVRAPVVVPTVQPTAVAPTAASDSVSQQLLAKDARIAQLEAEVARLTQKAAPTPPNAADLNQRGLAAVAMGDYDGAVTFMRQAASMGDSSARANLAAMYLNGTGVPQDARLGIALLETSAKDGNAVAAENLATLYEYGMAGQAVDLAKATRWNKRAAELGSGKARAALQRLRAQL
jgi:TPR repeat protein